VSVKLRPLSSRHRLTLWILTALLVVTVMGGMVVINRITSQLQDRADSELISVGTGAVQALELIPVAVLDEIGNEAAVGFRGDAIIILDGDGHMTALPSGNASDPDPLPDVSDFTMTELRRRSGVPFTLGDASGRDDSYRAVVFQLSDGSILIAARSLDDIHEAVHVLARVLLIAFIVLIVGVTALVWLISRHALKPLEDVIETAEAIESGTLSSRVEVASSAPDVERLADALNGMLARIEQAFGERERTELKLRQFVADASHELRTPLAAIVGYAELHNDGIAREPAQVDVAMRRIAAEGGRMQSLVDALLMLARLDEGRQLDDGLVELDAIAEESVHAATTIDAQRTFHLTMSPESTLVRGDAGALRQVVDNLLANVSAHTPPGTTAMVELHVEGADAVLTVTDDGPGLDAADVDKAFDRFWRAEQSRARPGGSGLGLSIVRELVHAHHGEITMHSAPGTGTCVELRVPTVRTRSSGTRIRGAPT
jgi:two-component system OmpR family sensor kinase